MCESPLYPACVTMRITINRLYFTGGVQCCGRLCNGGGLGTGESYVSYVLLNSVLHSSSSFADANFTALTGDRTRCDLSSVSDLKTGRMSCCCRQRRSCSDRPLT